MIGIMKTEEDEASCCDQETDAAPVKSKKKNTLLEGKSQSTTITSFFKPPPKQSPQTDSRPADLRSYFQVTFTTSNDKYDTPPSSLESQSRHSLVCGSGEGQTAHKKKPEFKVSHGRVEKSKEKKVKKECESGSTGDHTSKKRKKETLRNSGDGSEEDFEPPASRRKRKCCSVNPADVKELLEGDNACLENHVGVNTCVSDSVDAMQGAETGTGSCEEESELCNGGQESEDVGVNQSMVVSYEDFLNSSRADTYGEDDEECERNHLVDFSVKSVDRKKECVPGDCGITPVNVDSRHNGHDENVSSNVMTESYKTLAGDSGPLTPPDSGSSQENKGVECTPIRILVPSEMEETQEEMPSRKVLTITAQVHSPFEGQDRCLPPGEQDQLLPSCASPLQSSHILSQERRCPPRRPMSNVSVLESNPELMAIRVEIAEEKKAGPVYSIFQKKPAAIEKETAKDEVKTSKGESANVEDTEVGDKKDEGMKQSEGPETEEKELDKTPSNDVKESVKDSPKPARRTLRVRLAKTPNKSVDLSSSMDEFDEQPKPSKYKGRKQLVSQRVGCKSSSNERDKETDQTGGGEPAKKRRGPKPGVNQKYRAYLTTGAKGQGSIKLKLTAIKAASPKKSTKVAKAQQLLQKAKKGHQYAAEKRMQASQRLSRKATKEMKQGQTDLAVAVDNENTRPKGGKRANCKGNVANVSTRKGSKPEPAKVFDAEKVPQEGRSSRRRMGSKLKLKTPPKPPAKLAPIFTKKGQLAAAKKFKQDSILAAMATADSLALDENSRDSLIDMMVTAPSTHTGVQSLLGFNMLTPLKAAETTDGVGHPPFPKVVHVLQQDETVPLWNLPRPTFSKWRIKPEIIHKQPFVSFNKFCLGSVTLCRQPPLTPFDLKDFKSHPELSEQEQKARLEEIAKANPKFPVRKVFKMYQAKKLGESGKKKPDKGDTKTKEAEKSNSGKNSGKLQHRKRTAEDTTDGDTRRKMPRRESRGTARKSLDMEEEEGEEKVPRRSTRRSSRRLSARESGGEGKAEEANEMKCSKDNDKTTPDNAEKVTNAEDSLAGRKRAGMQWTEKYQPAAASEMIGNVAVGKKFHLWLTEWKKKTRREKEKTKKRGKANEKNKAKGVTSDDDGGDDSDDDFRYEDDDGFDSDEDDGLCNTVLLVGPHGVGKTAMVYACAQELGYQVFEVNASSRRNGRQILTELGEVTQSHQVARQPGCPANFFKASPSKSTSKMATPKKKKPAIPKAFAAFYKAGGKGGQSPKRSPVKRPSVKKTPNKLPKKSPVKKAATATKSNAQKRQSGLLPKSAADVKPKITSTSLILFDEVDVVFDEDKGFLSAITSFMAITKRPIVLTTSDPRFAYTLSARFDELVFKRPPLNSLASHLQLLCLAENVATKHGDMKLVASFFDRDLRRCLQNLQFWVCAGALPANQSRPNKSEHRPYGASKQSAIGDCSVVSANRHSDSITEPGLGSGARTPFDLPADEGSTDLSGMNGEANHVQDLIQELIDVETRIIVIGEFYSMKGHKPQDVAKILKDMELGENKGACHDQSKAVVSPTIHSGFFESVVGLGNVVGPMVDGVLQSFKEQDENMEATRRTAILQTFHNHGLDVAHHNLPYLLARGHTDKRTDRDALPSSQEFDSARTKAVSKLGGDLLHILADHTDRMACIDTMLPHEQKQDCLIGRYGNREWWQPLAFPGLEDDKDCVGEDYELVDARPYDARHESSILAINCLLEEASLSNCERRFSRVLDVQLDQALIDRVLPLLSACDEAIRLRQDQPKTGGKDSHHAVIKRLPLHQYTNHRTQALDYLPAIRGLCRTEKLRQEANLKRRFLHYLDSISLGLRPATYLNLASILDPDQSTE